MYIYNLIFSPVLCVNFMYIFVYSNYMLFISIIYRYIVLKTLKKQIKGVYSGDHNSNLKLQ